jgi:hypothetical protein
MMIFGVIIGLGIVSVLLALWSLWKQTKLEEVKKVKRELKKKRVIFQRES